MKIFLNKTKESTLGPFHESVSVSDTASTCLVLYEVCQYVRHIVDLLADLWFSKKMEMNLSDLLFVLE